LGVVEQVVRPVDGGAECLVAFDRAAMATTQHSEAIVEARREVGR
jgi:hypothetical protein